MSIWSFGTSSSPWYPSISSESPGEFVKSLLVLRFPILVDDLEFYLEVEHVSVPSLQKDTLAGGWGGGAAVESFLKNVPAMQETQVQFCVSWRPPGEGNGNPLQYFLPEKSHG